jgi:uncharacterized transporter YbjL
MEKSLFRKTIRSSMLVTRFAWLRLKAKLSEFETVIGRKSRINLKDGPSELTTERLHVTKRQVLGKSLADLNFEHHYGSVGTRINRAGVEFVPSAKIDYPE